MLPLNLYLLGPPRFEQGGQPIVIGRRKALALLVYLAVTGQAHNRDALAALFWPEATQQGARGNLRRILSELNKAIGKTRFVVDGDLITLVQNDSLWLDVAQFRMDVAAAGKHNHPSGELCQDCVELLTRAADLYKNHFLAGFTLPDCPEFDDWQFFETENLRNMLAAVFDQLGAAHMIREDYGTALHFARRRLNLDPLHEPAHRQLMRLYALDGQQTAALRQYKNCVRLLEEGLGVEPEEATIRLYEDIKARRFSLPTGTKTEQVVAKTPKKPLPAFLSGQAEQETAVSAFVARERELSQLEAAMESAGNGAGQILLIIGGAGRGKTMLVQEFSRRAQAADPDLVVISGHCDVITGIGDPYLPFREALAMLTGDVEARWAGGLISRQQARQLWQLMSISLPALVTHAPDLIDSFVPSTSLLERGSMVAEDDSAWFNQLKAIAENGIDNGLDQGRIFSQYTAVLKAIAGERPLLFILEDLHWVDMASSGLLFHLSRELADSRILLVGTYRPDEVASAQPSTTFAGDSERHPMAGIISEFKRQHGDIWLDLGDLAAVDGRQFVDAYLDAEPNQLGDAFRKALFQRTGGHALFTVELVRAMQERGDLQRNEAGQWIEGQMIDWQTLPVKVEGVIERRIERLAEDLQAILTIASVEGETFTAEVIALVQQMEQRPLVQQLSRELDKRHRLVTAQAIEWLNPGRQRLSIYRFQHQLFQHFLYNRLDTVERVFLHEAVGIALEQLYQGQTEKMAGRLAWHFEIAGLLDKAIDYSEQAGDVSAVVYANVEAAVHYKRAIQLLSQVESSQNGADAEKLARLYTRLGRVQELNSDFNEALATYDEMEQLAQLHSHQSMELAALIHQGRLRSTTTPVFNPEEGEKVAERGLQLARLLGDVAAEAKIQGNLLNLYRWTNRSQDAVQAGEATLELIDTLAPATAAMTHEISQQAAYIHNDLAHCYFAVGNLVRGMASSLKASEIWQELNYKPMQADSLATASYIHGYAGLHDKAIALSEKAWEISESISNLWGQCYCLFRVGYSHWENGRPDLAITAIKRCLRLSHLSGFPVPQAFTQADLALIYGELGAIQEAIETAEQALAIAESQLPVWRAYVLGTLAHLHILDENLAAAKKAIALGMEDAYREAYIVYFIPILLAEVELALKQGEYEQALELSIALYDLLNGSGLRLHIPDALLLYGQALIGLNQIATAKKRLEQARTEAKAMNAKRPLWSILLAMSRIEADVETAETLRQQARIIVTAMTDHIPEPKLAASFRNRPDILTLYT